MSGYAPQPPAQSGVTTVAFNRPRADAAGPSTVYCPPPPQPVAGNPSSQVYYQPQSTLSNFNQGVPSSSQAIYIPATVTPPQPPVDLPKGRRRGVCTHWNVPKAYGFIQDHAATSDSSNVFCHNSSLGWTGPSVGERASLAEGDEVEFEYNFGARGTEAINVTKAQFATDSRRRGTVVEFKADKGFGFVQDEHPEDLEGKQILVHHKKLKTGSGFKVLAPGELLEYNVVKGPKGYAAVEVIQLAPQPPSVQRQPASAAAAPLDYRNFGLASAPTHQPPPPEQPPHTTASRPPPQNPPPQTSEQYFQPPPFSSPHPPPQYAIPPTATYLSPGFQQNAPPFSQQSPPFQQQPQPQPQSQPQPYPPPALPAIGNNVPPHNRKPPPQNEGRPPPQNGNRHPSNGSHPPQGSNGVRPPARSQRMPAATRTPYHRPDNRPNRNQDSIEPSLRLLDQGQHFNPSPIAPQQHQPVQFDTSQFSLQQLPQGPPPRLLPVPMNTRLPTGPPPAPNQFQQGSGSHTSPQPQPYTIPQLQAQPGGSQLGQRMMEHQQQNLTQSASYGPPPLQAQYQQPDTTTHFYVPQPPPAVPQWSPPPPQHTQYQPPHRWQNQLATPPPPPPAPPTGDTTPHLQWNGQAFVPVNSSGLNGPPNSRGGAGEGPFARY